MMVSLAALRFMAYPTIGGTPQRMAQSCKGRDMERPGLSVPGCNTLLTPGLLATTSFPAKRGQWVNLGLNIC
jgi:hypothetical protein